MQNVFLRSNFGDTKLSLARLHCTACRQIQAFDRQRTYKCDKYKSPLWQYIMNKRLLS